MRIQAVSLKKQWISVPKKSVIITISLDIKKICDNLWTKEVRPQMVFIDHRLTQIDTDCEPLVQIKIKIFFLC